jgi:hypothetical protein
MKNKQMESLTKIEFNSIYEAFGLYSGKLFFRYKMKKKLIKLQERLMRFKDKN